MLSALSNLKERVLHTVDNLVDSPDQHGKRSSLRNNRDEKGMGNTINRGGEEEIRVWKEMLTEYQMNQLKLTREYQKLFEEKELQIAKLMGGGGNETTNTATMNSSSSKGHGLTEDDLRKMIQDYENQMRQNIVDKTEAQAEMRLHAERAQALAEQCTLIHNSHKDLEQEVARLRLVQNAYDANLQDSDQLVMECSALSAEVDVLRSRLSTLTVENDALATKLASNEKTLQLLSSSQPTNATASPTTESNTVSEEALKTQQEMYEKKLISAHEEMVRAIQREETKLSEIIAQHAEEIHKLKQEHLEALAGEQQKSLSALQEEREALERENSQRRLEEIAKLKQEISTYQENIDKMQEEIKELNEQRDTIETIAEALKNELSEAENRRISDLKQQNLELSKLHTESVEHMKAIAAEEKSKALQASEREFERKMKQMKAELDESKQLHLKEMTLRRQLHNELIDLKGNIRVFARIRPILPFEKENSENGNEEELEAMSFPYPGEVVVKRRKDAVASKFEFDKVFTQASTQEEIYSDIGPLVTSVLDGYSVCLFAYGQTGSGKTHTMQGTTTDPGVNIRALDDLFRIAEDRVQVMEFSFKLSVLEIYNETVRDLLSNEPPSHSASGEEIKEKLEIRLGKDNMVFVQDLIEVPVSEISQVIKFMEDASKNRAIGSHNMNEHSSRSHLVLTISVVGKNKLNGSILQGKLNLIDLAGSERVSKTDASGDRLKEAQNINKSLSALGDVIASLAQKNGHIPYRNSKLTFLLQNSLGGNSKVAMFVCASPTVSNAPESVCSLQFAARARSVELGQARKDVMGGSGEVEKYKKMAEDLEAKLASLTRNIPTPGNSTPAAAAAAAGSSTPTKPTRSSLGGVNTKRRPPPSEEQ